MSSTTTIVAATTLKTLANFSLKTKNAGKASRPLILSVARGSVVDFQSTAAAVNDAIVNAANEGCLGGGGVDGAITDAGGTNLHKDRLALPIVMHSNGNAVRCPTGTAVITGPNEYGTLRVNHVIHAVGPNYWTFDTFEEPDRLLKGAYQSSLECGRQAGIQSIAFALLSAGVFKGSRKLSDVLKIGVTGIRDWVLEEDCGSLESVTLCGFSERETSVLIDICKEELEPGEEVPVVEDEALLQEEEEEVQTQESLAELREEVEPTGDDGDEVDMEISVEIEAEGDSKDDDEDATKRPEL